MRSLLLISLVVLKCVYSFTEDWSTEFTYSAYLDEDESFRLYWTNLDGEGLIEFGMEVEATGWISIGISPRGQMPNSDIAIGWVDDDGEAYVQDRYTTSRTAPLYDAHQNVTLISGEESDGWTRIRFTRPKFACNDEDVALSQGTTRLIWAFHADSDPEEECFDSLSGIEPHSSKGSQSLNLDSGTSVSVELEDDVQTIDVTMSNISVPSASTTYFCALIPLSAIIEPSHAVKFDVIVSEGNEAVVHHSTAKICPESTIPDGSTFPIQASCDEFIASGLCEGGPYVYAWAIGGEPLYLPAHAGIPIGEQSAFRYVKLEVHYDNPEQRADIFDSSGIRISYTSQLRSYDAGMFFVGWHRGFGALGALIPPGLDRASTSGFASADCTESLLPETGINVIATLLHAHNIGAALNFRQIRDGQELPPIDSNWNYDFDYQQTVVLKEEAQILPGDELILDCYYNSSARSTWTYGGPATTEEMCWVFVTYYPALQWYGAGSWKTEAALSAWMSDAQQAGFLSGNATDIQTGFDDGSLRWDDLVYSSDKDGAQEFFNRLYDANYSAYNAANEVCSTGDMSDNVSFIAPAMEPVPNVDFEPFDLDLFECDGGDRVQVEATAQCVPTIEGEGGDGVYALSAFLSKFLVIISVYALW